MPSFTVLCRIDAFAGHTAEVEADDPHEAAELADEKHSAYTWTLASVAEFDDGTYVTLDEAGDEIEATSAGTSSGAAGV